MWTFSCKNLLPKEKFFLQNFDWNLEAGFKLQAFEKMCRFFSSVFKKTILSFYLE